MRTRRVMETSVNIIKRVILCLLALALICGSGTVFAADMPEGVRTVRIPCGINSLLYFDEQGNATGYLKEYFDTLARINHWEYEYVPAAWAEALDMLDTGEIDILYPVSMSPEREKDMDFSAMVGGYTASGLFVREESGFGYNDYESFDGARIAVTEGSSNESALAAFARNHGFSYEPVYIGTTEEKANALEDGTVDMLIFSASNELAGTKLVSVLDAEPFYFTVKKGNSELLSELNSGMQEIVMRYPDVLEGTLSGCLAGKNTENRTAFTKEENDFIGSGEKITVGFYSDTEPLAYVDEDGEYKGVYPELMAYAAETAGMNIELYPIDRGDDWYDLVTDGTIDFYIGSSDAIDRLNSGFLTATASFMEYETVLITKNDFEINREDNITIALTKAHAYPDDLAASFGNMEVLSCRTTKECLLAVRSGNADAALVNTLEYNYQSKNARFADLVQWANYRSKYGTVLITSKDAEPVMVSAMEKALGTLNDTKVSEVVNTNLNMPYQSSGLADVVYAARNILVILAVLIMIGAAAGILVWYVRSRQRAMEEKKKEELRIMAALSVDYTRICYVDLNADRYTAIEFAGDPDGGPGSEIFSEAISYYLNSVVQPEYRENVNAITGRDALIERFNAEKDFSVRYRIMPNDKGREYFEMHFVDVSESKDEHLMVLGFRCVDSVVREELAQKQALEEAYEAANSANKAKSEFLSKMSHDIRTPMNAIIGMTAIAEAHIDDRERVRDALGKITGSGKHLLALINEVLDMSKIESGKIELAEEKFSLPDLISGLITMVQPQITQMGHRLDAYALNIAHEDLIGDSLRIQQAFVNILGNAIKYTPDHGKICLTVTEKPSQKEGYGSYEFVFEDNGIGMSQEYLEHIFEPFSRAEDTRISKIQGTGLGMSITQNIIRMMNGDIRVESTVGKGSVFTVTVCLKLQDKPPETYDFSGLRVLVADSDSTAREAVLGMLAEMGAAAELARTWEEAAERLSDGNYSAVIVDKDLPGMDISGIPEGTAVVLCGYERPADPLGEKIFLGKPVFRSELARLLNKLREGFGTDEPAQTLSGVMNSDFSGRRALLVEDNELNLEIAQEVLEMAGLVVETAEDGKVASDKFAASAPYYYDIIFMDVQMPVMNGYEATKAIRAMARGDAGSVPIVAMTANAFVEDIQAAKDAGMNEHLAKPIDFDKLTAALKKYLG